MKHLVSKFCAAIFAASLLVAGNVHADTVTKFVVGGPPGGLFDIVMRIIAPRLGAELGSTVVIDNKPGAAGAVMMEIVKNAKPDGLTVGMINIAAASNETIISNKQYRLMSDFEPVGMYLFPANILIVNPALPVTDVTGLIEYLKKNQGSANYASGGNGSPGNLAGELFKIRTGAPALHVPYKGAPPAVLSVVTGETGFMFATASSAIGQVTSGKVRALAVTTSDRLPQLPDVPTVAQAGLADFEVSDWAGFVLPKGTPVATRDKLHAALLAVFADPQLREKLRQMTFLPAAKPLGPTEFSAFLQAEVTKWAKVVREAKIAQ